MTKGLAQCTVNSPSFCGQEQRYPITQISSGTDKEALIVSHYSFLSLEIHRKNWFFIVTTHTYFSIERADWPKLHDMFKAHDDKKCQRKFPVGFPVSDCALNLLFVQILSQDFVVHIEIRCVIKAKRVLLVCSFVRSCAGKTAPAPKRSCNSSRTKSN